MIVIAGFGSKLTAKKADAAFKITPREREIISLIASGLSNKEIANKLAISIKTVEAHRCSVMQKLEVHNTAMLIKRAFDERLI